MAAVGAMPGGSGHPIALGDVQRGIGQPGRPVLHDPCAEQKVLAGEVDAIVRTIHRRGLTHDEVTDAILAVAARLLAPEEITNPYNGEPLSHADAVEIADDFDELADVDGFQALRDWVIAQLSAMCGRSVPRTTSSSRHGGQ